MFPLPVIWLNTTLSVVPTLWLPNEPLIDVDENTGFASKVVTLVDTLPLSDINPAILAVVSVVVVEKLELTDVNEPLIFYDRS